MRKIFLIISTLLIFFTSTVLPMKKAEAVAPAAGAVAVYGAGAGVYVTAALLVAAGAAAVGYDEYSEEINTHANRVWNSTSQTIKDSVIASYEAAINTGRSTIELSDEVLDFYKGQALNIAYSAKDMMVSKFYKNNGTSLDGIYAITSGWGTYAETAGIRNLDPYKYDLYVNGVRAWGISWASEYETPSIWTVTVHVQDTDEMRVIGTGNMPHHTLSGYSDSATVWSAMKQFAHIYAVPKSDASYNLPASSTMASHVSSEIDKLKAGTGEIYLPREGILPRTLTGQNLTVNETTGTMTLPDGTIYTGDVTYKVPAITPPYQTDLSAPTMPLDNIKVGEGTVSEPLVQEPVLNPPAVDTSGILQGLWDWLKGILQAILDAIKSIAGSVVAGLSSLLQGIIDAVKAVAGAVVSGLSGLLQGIIDAVNAVKAFLGTMAEAIAEAIGAIFLPAEGYFTNFFKEINAAWAAKIPFISQLKEFLESVRDTVTGSQLPKIQVDLPERYGGRTMSIVDFSYFTEYRTWILNFIRFTAWFIFLKKLYARIPKVVGG